MANVNVKVNRAHLWLRWWQLLFAFPFPVLYLVLTGLFLMTLHTCHHTGESVCCSLVWSPLNMTCYLSESGLLIFGGVMLLRGVLCDIRKWEYTTTSKKKKKVYQWYIPCWSALEQITAPHPSCTAGVSNYIQLWARFFLVLFIGGQRCTSNMFVYFF